MAIAALIVAIIAVLVAAASAEYTRRSTASAQRSAEASERSAGASEEALAIERDRRLQDRRPRLTAEIDRIRTAQRLRITLDTDEALAGLDVTMTRWSSSPGRHQPQPGWDAEFNPRVYGVVVPPPGEAALTAYCYNPHTGSPAGLTPHESITWAVNVKNHIEQVLLSIT